MESLHVEQIALLEDNYAYLLRDAGSGKTAVIDPSEAQPVLRTLERLGWKLDYILNTHHHWDHTGGNEALKAATGCKVVGPASDAERIPGIDLGVDEKSGFRLGESEAKVFSIPAHTRGHIAFYFRESKALFCGDTLFSLGCGRLFEGTPGEMWTSLSKLLALPDDTLVYCAHEYTEANVKFAQSLEPQSAALEAKAREVRALRAEKRSTVPSLLGEERRLNPFLRADSPELRTALNLSTSGPVKVFAEIRRRKDEFRAQ